MSVKISELPILDSLADNDVIAGVDTSANVTSKIEMATLKNYIDTNTQYTAGTNINITNNVISAPFVYDKTQTNALLDDFKDETNASIEDLKDEKDAQIEELQSEVDSLSTIYNAFPTESGEGESLTLDDTAEVKFKKFDLKGNTSQQTYNGYNLINVDGSTVENLTSITSITKGNNYIHGVASASTWQGLQLFITNLEAGTYYYKHYTKIISGASDTKGIGSFRVNQNNQSGTVIINQSTNGDYANKINEQIITIPSTGQYVFTYRCGNAINSDRELEIQDIVLSKTNQQYEPYVGGTASPNPSYPQPINVVSGDNEISVVGKNLFNKADYITDSWSSAHNGWKLNLEPGTYTLSANVKLRMIKGSEHNSSGWGNVKFGSGNANANTFTFSISENFNQYLWMSYTDSGGNEVSITKNNVSSLNIQLEKGSSASSYLPYSKDTYNIDLPVENLFEVTSTSSGVTGGITYNKLDENTFTITSSLESSSWARADITLPNALMQNTSYTMKVNFTSTNTSITTIRFSFRKADGTEVSYQDLSSGGTVTFNTGSNIVTFIRIYVATATGIAPSTITFTNLQLEKGSKQNNFTPYGTTPIELCKIGNYQDYFGKSDGRNVFDKDNANYVNGWIDGTTMRLNTINGNRMFYIPCKPNTTYTISRSVITSSFRTTTYDSTPFPTVTRSNVDYTVGNVLKNDNGKTLTITTGANAKYLVVHYGKIEDANLTETLESIMIEKGSSASDYQPYGVGKWYLHKEIGKVVFNGSEYWVLQSINDYGIANFQLDVIRDYIGGFNNAGCLCSHYTPQDSLIADTKGQGFLLNPNKSLFFRTNSSTASTVEAFKTWLASNNVTFYYALATPVNTTLEDMQSIFM